MLGRLIGALLIMQTLAVQGQLVLERKESDRNLMSPNFPNNYPPNSDREWRFTSAYGKWSIIYKVIDLEWSRSCEKDSLDIYDGDTSITKVKRRFCNKLEKHSPFLSTGNTVRIHFRSDSFGESSGFHLEVIHVASESDFKKMMAKRRDEAARITILDDIEETPATLIALIVSLGVVVFIFVALLSYVIISVSKRRRKARDRLIDIKPHPVFEAAGAEPGSGRRYTRQMSNESNPQMALQNKTRHSLQHSRSLEARCHNPLQHSLSLEARPGQDSHLGYNSYI